MLPLEVNKVVQKRSSSEETVRAVVLEGSPGEIAHRSSD